MKVGSLGEALLRAACLSLESLEELLEKPQKPSAWERLTFYAVPMSERQAEAVHIAKAKILKRQLSRDRKKFFEISKRYHDEKIKVLYKEVQRYKRVYGYIKKRIRKLERRENALEDAFNNASYTKAFYISQRIAYVQDQIRMWRKLLYKVERILYSLERRISYYYSEMKKAADFQERLKNLDPSDWYLPELPGVKEVPISKLRLSHDDMSEYTDVHGFRIHHIGYI